MWIVVGRYEKSTYVALWMREEGQGGQVSLSSDVGIGWMPLCAPPIAGIVETRYRSRDIGSDWDCIC